MKVEKLKTNYLELAYCLYRLFVAQNDITKRLQECEFDSDDHFLKDYRKKSRAIKDMKKKTEMALAHIAKEAMRSGILIPFEYIAQKYRLTNEEKYILLMIFFNGAEARHPGIQGRELLMLLGYRPGQFIEKSKVFENLLNKNLIEIVDHNASIMLFEAEFVLSVNVLKQIAGDDKLIFGNTQNEVYNSLVRSLKRDHQIDLLVVRKPLLSFDQIVLDDDIKKEIKRILYQTKHLGTVFEKWGFDKTIKYGKGTTVLFYGPPGTGKTATSEAIAHSLRKKVGIVNYARLLGNLVGDSEKNLSLSFEQAKKEDCVLVFDEADALFARRLTETHSTDRLHNYMTNILMQELEQFEGIVILTTNREVILDEAFNRRILLKLKFDIPGPAIRARIWRALIPTKVSIARDVDFEELGRRYELAGGEIKNAILNAAMDCASRHQKKLTMLALMEFAEKEIRKTKDRTRKSIGFMQNHTFQRIKS